MKKKILFVLIVFIMFLLPFMVISVHFSNTVSELSKNYVLLDMESGINYLSSKITSVLLSEYDIAKEIRGISDRNFLISKIKEISNKSFVKKISLYDINGNLIYSTSSDEKKISKDEIFLKAKKFDIPIGIIEYPNDYPPQLITYEKISNYILRSIVDLGYLGDILFQYSKKNIGHIYLIDADGNIIFDSNYDFVFKSSKIDNDLLKTINEFKSKEIFNYKGSIKINGKDYLISISNVETTTWWVLNIIENSKAEYPAFKSWVRRVVISGVLIILSFSVITMIIYDKFFIKNT